MSDNKIIIPIAFMFIYVLIMVIIFKQVDFWDYTMFKDTIFWFTGTAFVMFFNFNHASEENYFKNTIINQIKFVVVLEFVVNLYSFSLPVELILMPFITLVAMISSYASIKSDHKMVKPFCDFILGIFGIVLIIYTVKEIVSDFQGFITLKNLRDFLLPVLSTLVFLPYIYLLALYSQYESLYRRTLRINKDKRVARYTIWRTFLAYRLNLKKVIKFAKSVGVLHLNNKKDVDALFSKPEQ